MTLPYFQVDTRNERLKTLSVKHASLWEEFNQKLDISWIYHDHGLEGVVLQYQEISVALNNKVASDNSFMPMYQEIKNMSAGIKAIREQLVGKKARDRISRSLLQQCYSILSQKLRGIPEGDGLRLPIAHADGRYQCDPDVLRRLKALGVRISMDDFGTGYSSLGYLQRFPFDRVKIDRSFIQNAGASPQAAAIVRAVIGLGHNLEMAVTAEGVETGEQLDLLRRQHCHEIQGFLIGRPMPPDAVDELLTEQFETMELLTPPAA